MTNAKKYLVDTTNDRVRVEPVPGGIILKIKPKRGRAWLEFKMPDHVANMTVNLIRWGIEEKFDDPLTVELQNDACNCYSCRQLRICAKLGMAPSVHRFPDDHIPKPDDDDE